MASNQEWLCAIGRAVPRADAVAIAPSHRTRETLAKPDAPGAAAGMGFDTADNACFLSGMRSERS
jgi:hypothetical protein